MGYKVNTSVWDFSKSKGGDLTVLLAIADNADNDTAIAFPSIKSLAKKSRLSERTVQYAIGRLKKLGELSVINRVGRGRISFFRVDLHLRLVMVKGAELAPFTEGEIVQILHLLSGQKRCKRQQEKVQSTTLKGANGNNGIERARDSLEPSIEPSGNGGKNRPRNRAENIASEKATAAYEELQERMEKYRTTGTGLVISDRISVAVIQNDLGGKDAAMKLRLEELRMKFMDCYVRRELAAFTAARRT